MSKILVTGGAGFIGSDFIKYLLESDLSLEIINLDKLTYAGNLENLTDVANNKNYRFIQGDICDRDLVNDLVKQVNLIVHFAAESHVDRSIADGSDFIKTNIEGTGVLLEAAFKNGGIRFHHISTDEVFGSLSPTSPKFNEQTSYNPRSPYSASKASSDHLVRSYFYTHKLPITISNCSNNYGPYQFPEKMIPLFITNLLEDKKIPIYGSGDNVRDWIHVRDHNRGVKMIIDKGKIGETYCLGGNNEIANIDISKMILKLLDKSEEMIKYVKDRPGHDKRYAIDFSKAEKELGWNPTVNFNEGLKETVEWYKNNKEWWQKLKNKNN
jgi:dTDP-glucose 4,6-dehydratase